MAYGEYYTDPLFTSTHTHSQHLLLHPSLPVSLSLSLDFSQSTTVTWKNWRVMLDCLSFSDYNPVFPGWSYLFCLWTSLSHVFSDIREAIRFRIFLWFPSLSLTQSLPANTHTRTRERETKRGRVNERSLQSDHSGYFPRVLSVTMAIWKIAPAV